LLPIFNNKSLAAQLYKSAVRDSKNNCSETVHRMGI